MKRDLLNMKPEMQRDQDRMATNIARLKSKKAKKQQAHLLCQSLVRMIKGSEMEMFGVKITNEGGVIWIQQDDGNGGNSVVTLHPDQIPVVCKWLSEACYADSHQSTAGTNN
ncbi:hypothetical protein [Paraburkholderia acidisoli]|uniref:Uncharacterized protein n=1 Tax=Paraburkholderia acidisoli TaxID=2571748 RepID=A0A7Z2GRI7_9BURK|nr:hypothetical protein [Paraburkholderia acidisoli]QGZ66389.1 hypothetical protein FAZ98_31890 [Paraburkholderia acidisoli]